METENLLNLMEATENWQWTREMRIACCSCHKLFIFFALSNSVRRLRFACNRFHSFSLLIYFFLFLLSLRNYESVLDVVVVALLLCHHFFTLYSHIHIATTPGRE